MNEVNIDKEIVEIRFRDSDYRERGMEEMKNEISENVDWNVIGDKRVEFEVEYDTIFRVRYSNMKEEEKKKMERLVEEWMEIESF